MTFHTYQIIIYFIDYPDLFAGVVIMILAVLLAAGAKEFAFVNKIFTGILRKYKTNGFSLYRRFFYEQRLLDF